MLLDAIRSVFARLPDAPSAGNETVDSRSNRDPVHIAACVLLLDVAHADGEFSAIERSHIESVLTRHFGLTPEQGHELILIAGQERARAVDHFQFTRVLQERYDLGQKMVLAEVLWGLVLADGQIAEHEHYLARKIANLLELEPAYLSTAKKRAEAGRAS
jgi:uncharacterized tellurite resistance protein B-like protein